MKVSRRRVLIGGGATVVAGGVALSASPAQTRIHGVLARSFGAQIAGHTATADFIADYVALLSGGDRMLMRLASARTWPLNPGAPESEARIVSLFGRTTNAVRASETGEDLIYLGLGDPYESPCQNPLSSHWL